MKYVVLLCSLCVCISSHIIAKFNDTKCQAIYNPFPCFNCDNVYSRTFMFIRPVYEHVAMRNYLWNTIILSKNGTACSAAQVIGMYQHSRQSQDDPTKFAKYFLMKNKSMLLVSGDSNTQDEFSRDIRAEWLGLPSNFRGFMSLCPEQSQAGVLLEYNQDLSKFCDISCFSNSHISIVVPYIHAEHNLHLSQEFVQNPGTNPSAPRDIIEAFRQPNWHNAKIAGKTTRSQVPEVRFQFWRTYMDEDDTQFAYYSSFIIPTNTKPNPNYLFNATTGNGGHAAINAGVVIQVPVTEVDPLCGRMIWFSYLDASYRFHNHQWRTYDLKGKPFSRYLLFAGENNPHDINVPGVNVLTLHSKVRAYGLIDFVTGVRWQMPWGSIECSYNMWAHSREHVKPDCECGRPFNKGIQGDFTPGALPQSASQSTIATLAANDSNFVTVKLSDLNIHSAATPGALTNSFNAAAGLQHTFGSVTVCGGLGGFVEWSSHNSPLDSWGIWAKCTATF
ncbi:MAG TPA: hypothetical protein VGW78_02550 [Candidatus Babeliales bacterium]|jgi:hypothetical protein|nr:hypothetical protein [Candidatus Babeliales bacterium]